MLSPRLSVIPEAFKAWLGLQYELQPPKIPISKAIAYALGEWDALTLFLTDQLADRQQRLRTRPACCGAREEGFLFVGRDEAGENLAGVYSLIATPEANEANPVAYLASSASRRTRRRASTSCCRTTGRNADPEPSA